MRYIIVLLVIGAFVFAFASENVFAVGFPLDVTSIQPVFQAEQEGAAAGPRFLQRKTPATAVLLALFIPSAGHLYMGQWSRGLSYATFEGVGYVLWTVRYNDGVNRTGLIWFLGGRILELVDVWQVATRGYSDFSFHYNPENGGIDLAFMWRF